MRRGGEKKGVLPFPPIPSFLHWADASSSSSSSSFPRRLIRRYLPSSPHSPLYTQPTFHRRHCLVPRNGPHFSISRFLLCPPARSPSLPPLPLARITLENERLRDGPPEEEKRRGGGKYGLPPPKDIGTEEKTFPRCRQTATLQSCIYTVLYSLSLLPARSLFFSPFHPSSFSPCVETRTGRFVRSILLRGKANSTTWFV